MQSLAGALALTQGRWQQAIGHLRNALSERPAAAGVLANLAVAYLGLGQRSKACTALKKAIAANPLDEKLVSLYSDLLIQDGNGLEALPVLTRHLDADPKSAAVWDRVAQVWFVQRDFKKALKALEHEASIENVSRVWNNIAVVNIKLGRIDEAERYFHMALVRGDAGDDDAWTAVFNYSKLLAQLGKLDHSIEIVEWALGTVGLERIKASVNLQNVLVQAIAVYSARRDFEKAMELCERALATDGDLAPSTYCNLLMFATFYTASVSKDSQRCSTFIEMASDLLGRGLLKEKDRVMLINNVAFSLLEFGDLNGGEKWIARMSGYTHRSPLVTATMGLWNIRKGHIEKGELLYKEAIGLSNNREMKDRIRQKLYLELGRCALKDGRINQARRYLTKAREMKHGLPEFTRESRALIEGDGTPSG